jgi:hypothetical protein
MSDTEPARLEIEAFLIPRVLTVRSILSWVTPSINVCRLQDSQPNLIQSLECMQGFQVTLNKKRKALPTSPTK